MSENASQNEHPRNSALKMRFATRKDAAEIARLLTQLGHPTSQIEVESRWAEWEEQGNSALVVDAGASTLAAFCQLHQMQVLHRPQPVGRITALIVDESQRSTGIGRALVASAESLLASAGCGLLEITSNVSRTRAHEFYEALGFERTSVRLVKDVSLLAPSAQ